MSFFLQLWCRSLFERAQFLGRVPRRTLCDIRQHCGLIRLDICVSGRGAFGVADGASSVVRVGTVTFVTTVTICCDNIFAP